MRKASLLLKNIKDKLHPPGWVPSTRSQDVKDVLQMEMLSVLLFIDPHSSSCDMLEEKNVKKEAGESDNSRGRRIVLVGTFTEWNDPSF